MSYVWRAWRIVFFIIVPCTHITMQIRESQAALEETCEFTFLPAFQRKNLVAQWLGEVVQDQRW